MFRLPLEPSPFASTRCPYDTQAQCGRPYCPFWHRADDAIADDDDDQDEVVEDSQLANDDDDDDSDVILLDNDYRPTSAAAAVVVAPTEIRQENPTDPFSAGGYVGYVSTTSNGGPIMFASPHALVPQQQQQQNNRLPEQIGQQSSSSACAFFPNLPARHHYQPTTPSFPQFHRPPSSFTAASAAAVVPQQHHQLQHHQQQQQQYVAAHLSHSLYTTPNQLQQQQQQHQYAVDAMGNLQYTTHQAPPPMATVSTAVHCTSPIQPPAAKQPKLHHHKKLKPVPRGLPAYIPTPIVQLEKEHREREQRREERRARKEQEEKKQSNDGERDRTEKQSDGEREREKKQSNDRTEKQRNDGERDREKKQSDGERVKEKKQSNDGEREKEKKQSNDGAEKQNTKKVLGEKGQKQHGEKKQKRDGGERVKEQQTAKDTNARRRESVGHEEEESGGERKREAAAVKKRKAPPPSTNSVLQKSVSVAVVGKNAGEVKMATKIPIWRKDIGEQKLTKRPATFLDDTRFYMASQRHPIPKALRSVTTTADGTTTAKKKSTSTKSVDSIVNDLFGADDFDEENLAFAKAPKAEDEKHRKRKKQLAKIHHQQHHRNKAAAADDGDEECVRRERQAMFDSIIDDDEEMMGEEDHVDENLDKKRGGKAAVAADSLVPSRVPMHHPSQRPKAPKPFPSTKTTDVTAAVSSANVSSVPPPQQKLQLQQQQNATTTTTKPSTVPKGGVRKAHVPKFLNAAAAAAANLTSKLLVPLEPLNRKVPFQLRQRHLATIHAEYVKICGADPPRAIEGAQNEEKSVLDRCNGKMGYLAAIPMLIKRLRDAAAHGHGQEEGGGQITRRRDSVSHTSVLLGRHAKTVTCGLHRADRSSTAAQHTHFSETDFYNALHADYLLPDQQLWDNGYPRWAPAAAATSEHGDEIMVLDDDDDELNANGMGTSTASSSGKGRRRLVEIRLSELDAGKSRIPFVDDSVLSRVCDRCGKEYRLTREGDYAAGASSDQCIFHWGRAWKKRVSGTIESRYNCCDQPLTVQGCDVAPHHITQTQRLSTLRNYAETPRPFGVGDPRSKKVYALDCEMVYTVWGTEVARLSVVDIVGDLILDLIIRPEHRIVDCNTKFSGLKPEQVMAGDCDLNEAQQRLFELVNAETILIGHSLESDLRAMHLVHRRVVDTSVVFPHRMGPPFKRALKTLASEITEMIIQDDESGHDSKEDALACMRIMLRKCRGAGGGGVGP